MKNPSQFQSSWSPRSLSGAVTDGRVGNCWYPLWGLLESTAQVSKVKVETCLKPSKEQWAETEHKFWSHTLTLHFLLRPPLMGTLRSVRFCAEWVSTKVSSVCLWGPITALSSLASLSLHSGLLLLPGQWQPLSVLKTLLPPPTPPCPAAMKPNRKPKPLVLLTPSEGSHSKQLLIV